MGGASAPLWRGGGRREYAHLTPPHPQWWSGRLFPLLLPDCSVLLRSGSCYLPLTRTWILRGGGGGRIPCLRLCRCRCRRSPGRPRRCSPSPRVSRDRDAVDGLRRKVMLLRLLVPTANKAATDWTKAPRAAYDDAPLLPTPPHTPVDHNSTIGSSYVQGWYSAAAVSNSRWVGA